MGFGATRSASAIAAIIACVGFAACSGGGGGGSNVNFSFASTGTTLSEGAAATDVQVVLHTSLAMLTTDATVEVVDAGTGTADSGADYAAFAPVTLTFPAGSTDGATQTVALDPLDDALVDGASETARLRLQNATGAGVTSPAQFVATLTDLHTAAVAFASSADATPDEDAGPVTVALELDCGVGVTLGVAVSVRVSDLRSGSAVPPADYSSFPAQTVTFPIGTADGAVQTVAVQVVDDATTEGDETVEFGLSNPSTTCTVGAIGQHVLTITDDDVGGPAAFVGTEGPAGTGNALAYDESLALGSRSVGAGPNAGTLVRVANGGGQSMDLAAPRLAGNHPNDFAVDIESSGMPFVAGLVTSDAPAPLVPVADGGPGVALALDAPALAELAGRQQVALHGVELPGLGAVTLELVRRDLPFAPDAKLAIDGITVPDGLRALTGDLQIWKGGVAGIEGSHVFLALTADSARGYVRFPEGSGELVQIVPNGPGRVRLVREPELLALGIVPPAQVCSGELVAPGAPGIEALEAPPTAALTLSNCRLALETDWQFFQDCGSSSTTLTNYVTALIAAVSDQYTTDVQATLSIAYLGIHTTSNDGWTSPETGDTADLLDEFRAAWSNNFPVQADLAHFLSGANLGGGIAYVNVLCNQGFGFGASANMTGSIDWSSWNGSSGGFTWDFVVVAHELGHNFGSQHTHDYCPPLDRCYANCQSTVCSRGTLMSYCHVSCGGLANIDLLFHPVCANIMRERINASCMDDSALAPGDYLQYRVRFNPMTTTGARSATLEFAHDAPNATQPFRVQLTGTAN